MDAAVPMDTLDADAANAAAVAAAAGPSGRAAVAVPPPRRERSKRIKRGEKQAEKKKKKEQESERLKAERAERLKAEEAATKAATREAKEAAREARKSARDMRPPQPRAKKGKGTLGQDARPAAVSPVPSPSRLRAQTGTTFAFGWEGDGIIKHGRGGRARSEDSDQGYVSTYYHGFSRKLQRGGTEELFQVGDSVQLYGAEQHADIQLAVLQDMFEDCLGTMWARLNWYYLPTEVPEAALNIAEGGVARGNEIFRSNHLDDVEVSCIQAKIVVRGLTPEEQAAGKPSEDRGAAQRSASAGYVLWRSFDVYKKRVHQIGEEGADSDDEGDSDADGMFSSESESEEEDRGTRDGEWDFAEARNHEAHDKKHSKRPAIQQQRGNHAFMLPTTRVAPSPDARQLSPDGSPLGDMETLSVFARAREVLRPGALPASMPCREREREEVGDFLRQSLQLGGVGRGLYVSGVPGTGKTATVYEVVRSLREEWEANEIPQFRFVEINGMSLPDPAYAFSVLHEEVTGRYCSPQKAADNLDKYWSSYSEQRACTVLLLDEVDLLVTRKQNVLYKLLDWPTYPFARLIVVAIANTMDLPERLLPRLGSRLGLQRVSFKPYDQEDIRKIVAARLGSLAAFNTDAIEICARKVASVSGDVRRALQICRRASEVAEERCNWEVESRVESPDPRSPSADGENKIQVEIEDVLAAVRDMSNKSNQENITELPLHGRLVLCILANQNQRTDEGVLEFAALASKHRAICRKLDLAKLAKTEHDAGACDFGTISVRFWHALNSFSVESGTEQAEADSGPISAPVSPASDAGVEDMMQSPGEVALSGDLRAISGEGDGGDDDVDEMLEKYINDSAGTAVQNIGGARAESSNGGISDDVLVLVCSRLAACRLLHCSSPRHGCIQVIQLNVPADDIIYGLKDDAVCSKALTFLRTM